MVIMPTAPDGFTVELPARFFLAAATMTAAFYVATVGTISYFLYKRLGELIEVCRSMPAAPRPKPRPKPAGEPAHKTRRRLYLLQAGRNDQLSREEPTE